MDTVEWIRPADRVDLRDPVWLLAFARAFNPAVKPLGVIGVDQERQDV
jgi:hypothetical protein